MTTALYRINGGEVIKISLSDQMWADRNTTYWGVLTTASYPDGTQVRPIDGDLRVLGYSKFADVGGNIVRNATQPEIDTFAPAQTADENLQDKDGGLDLFNVNPRFRKVFKAMLKEFLNEFGKTTNPKAQMSVFNGNIAQTMTAGVFETITAFSTPKGVDDESFDNISVDLPNNRIQINANGRHFVSYTIAFEGDGNAEFLFDIARNGNRQSAHRTRRKLGTAGDVGSCSASGFLSIPDTPPTNITLVCRNEEGTDKNLTIRECQIVVYRLENNATRDLTTIMSAIDAQFSEND